MNTLGFEKGEATFLPAGDWLQEKFEVDHELEGLSTNP
jgi:hypothetical protein